MRGTHTYCYSVRPLALVEHTQASILSEQARLNCTVDLIL